MFLDIKPFKPFCLADQTPVFQTPRVLWTFMWTTTVTWMLLTYLSAWSTTSPKLHRGAEATSSALHHYRWSVVTFLFHMFLVESVNSIQVNWVESAFIKLILLCFFSYPLIRSWRWERKALNVWCPSWSVWWSGVKTSTSTPTPRPASVRHQRRVHVIYQYRARQLLDLDWIRDKDKKSNELNFLYVPGLHTDQTFSRWQNSWLSSSLLNHQKVLAAHRSMWFCSTGGSINLTNTDGALYQDALQLEVSFKMHRVTLFSSQRK